MFPRSSGRLQEEELAEKKTVLVISPFAGSQMYLGVVMKRMWHFTILTKTPMDSIRICESNKIDLILLDGNLPADDLFSAVRLLRMTPLTRDIPLAVFLAEDHQSLTQALLQNGCSAVLTKPIDFSVAYGLLNRIIDQFRTTPRIPLKVRVAIEEGTPEKSLMSVDVSEGGIYLRTLHPLPEGTVVHLVFTLPRDEEHIRLSAEVVRAFSLGDRLENEPGMGLRFLEVTEAVRAKLRNYVQWVMMADLEWEPEFLTA
jgi:uncharacterized protein (TIGR02266 family)